MMQHKVDEIIEHLSISHQQLARVLEAKRHVAVRMAQIVHDIPDQHPDLDGFDGLVDSAQVVSKSVVSYLNSLADLQEMVAENLSHIMKELLAQEEE
ncbi:nucleoside-diphosphate sugar epimerase [Paenibacillus sp. SYP-B4298]|uniref:nucleoside-diphosphate sugar epimerase n=1 Tax=Paenibacillus sp. SYP-B4298 TaxID=2996034 RepID=UPI002FD82FFB